MSPLLFLADLCPCFRDTRMLADKTTDGHIHTYIHVYHDTPAAVLYLSWSSNISPLLTEAYEVDCMLPACWS